MKDIYLFIICLLKPFSGIGSAGANQQIKFKPSLEISFDGNVSNGVLVQKIIFFALYGVLKKFIALHFFSSTATFQESISDNFNIETVSVKEEIRAMETQVKIAIQAVLV